MKKIAEKVELLIKEGKIDKGNKIVLFGANQSSVNIIEMLSGFNIVAIIDNDSRKKGQVIRGIQVYQPDEYLHNYDDSVRIIIASEYYAQMCNQLEELGYYREQQVFIVWYGNRFYDVSDETFVYHANRARRGLQIYNQLNNGSIDYIFICPYAGTGDIYLIGLYLKEYTRRHRIKDYIVAMSSRGCCKVGELFDLPCESFTQDDIEGLMVFSRMVGPEKTNIKILNDGFLQVMVKRLRGYKNLDFHTMFQKCVFEMSERISQAKIKQVSSDDLFEKYKLVKGKTILLSPYANTIIKLPEVFWSALAEKLKIAGYSVCTNSCGEGERPIRGTEGIFIPYNMVVDFLNKAGGFIGMRSGLCDIISSTKAKMVVLYPYGNIFGACSTFDYFSLEKMGLKKDNLMEIVFREQELDEIIIDFLMK